MKYLITLPLLAASLAALSGCKEVKLTDGKIPAGFEQYAREAEGVYSGDIARTDSGKQISSKRAQSLKISFVEGRIVATPSSDWIGEGCHSKIGALQSVEVSGTKLKTAVFAFNPGSCHGTDTRLVVRMFDQSSGKPKLVAWVTTGYTPSTSTQSAPNYSTQDIRAHLRKN